MCYVMRSSDDHSFIFTSVQRPYESRKRYNLDLILLPGTHYVFLDSMLSIRQVPSSICCMFDDLCRHAFDLKQEVHLRLTCDHSRVNWEEFVRCQVRANETY